MQPNFQTIKGRWRQGGKKKSKGGNCSGAVGRNAKPFSKSIRTNPMKGGARRKTISSELPSPQQHSFQSAINDQGNDQVEYDERMREQEHQQLLNDGEDGGNQYDEEEGEDCEEDDQSGDGDIHGGADEGEHNGDEERPKLAEGFYEIEAVRRKRIRKGETQYLIKWRGWPEAANTWEPVENLVSCSDFIDAFEESTRSGKQRSNRKRRRKHSVTPTPQSKKKQKQQSQESSPAATYDVPSVKITIIEEPLSFPSVHNSNFCDGTENNVGGTSNNGAANHSNDTRSLMVSPQIGERKARNKLDANLNELKVASSSNQESMSEFAIHIQEDRPTEGDSGVEIGPANGILKADGAEPLRASPRIGARRRKCGAVKRFKQEPDSVLRNDASGNTTRGSVVVVDAEIKNINDLDCMNIVDAPRSISTISKIIKPVNYSTSILNDTEEVSVSFLVRRSDGEEVVVDNKYLKENNPILLINFYEQHLRYNSPSE
ncbi:chromo domain protein LHP1-like [Cynara cardunculus var. scolymus]|uniref:chromo domain protein LHP1-like n=1 Tax=Cynara cardunculus var. scolymus TaxID=59895 RepID=UPI000D6288EE|nr:chromo domain protein LHP1-like [Cynara cardunculus var. scolymus]